ncbi:MAG: hypothetical protein R8K21_06670 [Mariprofundales bacterium]
MMTANSDDVIDKIEDSPVKTVVKRKKTWLALLISIVILIILIILIILLLNNESSASYINKLWQQPQSSVETTTIPTNTAINSNIDTKNTTATVTNTVALAKIDKEDIQALVQQIQSLHKHMDVLQNELQAMQTSQAAMRLSLQAAQQRELRLHLLAIVGDQHNKNYKINSASLRQHWQAIMLLPMLDADMQHQAAKWYKLATQIEQLQLQWLDSLQQMRHSLRRDNNTSTHADNSDIIIADKPLANNAWLAWLGRYFQWQRLPAETETLEQRRLLASLNMVIAKLQIGLFPSDGEWFRLRTAAEYVHSWPSVLPDMLPTQIFNQIATMQQQARLLVNRNGNK